MATTLKATARIAGKNLTNIREEGNIPAVVYGAGNKTSSITISLKDFLKVRKDVGESGSFVLDLEGDKMTVLVHDIVADAVRGVPQHVDFLAIDVTKPIVVNLPIEFTGVSEAVKSGQGTLTKVLHEIEVRGLIKDLPHSVTVDLATLNALDSHVSIGDIALPKGVEALGNASDLVASVAAVKEEVEEYIKSKELYK